MNKTYLIAGGALLVVGGAIAMAIRGDARGERVVDPLTADREAAMAQRERAEAEEMRMREEMHVREDEQATKIAELVGGARPGQPGPFFDEIHFGSAGLSSSMGALQKLHDDAVHHGFTIGVQPQELDVSIPGAALHAILHEWGDPPMPIRDPGSHAELTFLDNPALAQLQWRPYETLPHLLDPGDDRPPGSTPFSVVGAKVDDLSLTLGTNLVQVTRGDYAWALPTFDDGKTQSTMTATLEAKAGVITSVTLQFDLPPDDVANALRKVYGEAGAMGIGPWKHRALEISIIGHPPDGATVIAKPAK